MNSREVESLAWRIALPVAEQLSLELVDVEYVRESGRRVLRFVIDRPEGVSHEDCQAVSQAVERALDEADPIPASYVLEVQSPGLDRILRRDAEFAKYAGREVEVRLFEPIDGRRRFHGELVGLRDGFVAVRVNGAERFFPRSSVSRTQLVPKF